MNKLLKGIAWVKAPKLMFAARHPRKAAAIKAIDWAADLAGIRRRKRHPSMATTAAKGLGAAALAVPVGLWVGRKVRGRQEAQGGQTAAS